VSLIKGILVRNKLILAFTVFKIFVPSDADTPAIARETRRVIELVAIDLLLDDPIRPNTALGRAN
jgi:hypothetical protein